MNEIVVALLVFAGCAVLLLGWSIERPPGQGRPARARADQRRPDPRRPR